MSSSLIDNPSVALPSTLSEPEAKPVKAQSSAENDDTRLRAYTQLKLSLAAQVRLLREAVKILGDARAGKRCDALMTKLAGDRFTLAVLGQFKRGKSSLMNAIIGRELLPVGVLPLTSAITVLRFGVKERLLIEHAHWTFPRDVPIERLAEFVTENSNPGNRQQVLAAYLELPLPFLRRGLEFVDTPGVGSAIEANTATTLRFLPACDAAIFVTSADAPLTRTELEFLHEIRQHARKLFLVVNKIDLLAPAERAQMVEFATRTIRRETGAGQLRVFPISARGGLAAKLRADSTAYARSGLPELESALAAFLTEEKASVFLASISDKAARLAELASAEVEARVRAESLPEPELRERRAQLQERLRRSAAERANLAGRLREHFLQGAMEVFTDDFDDRLQALRANLPRQLERLLKPCGRQFAGRSARRIVRALVRLHGRTLRLWVAERLARLAAESSPGFTSAGGELARNLANIPRAAAEVAGVRIRTAADTDQLPAWRPAGFAASAPVEIWNPELPGVTWLPTGFVRPSVADALLRQTCHRLLEHRAKVIEHARRALGDAFDNWTGEVNAVAAEADTRALAALTTGMTMPAQARGAAALAGVRENMARLQNEVIRFGTDDLSVLRSDSSLAEEVAPTIAMPAAETQIDPARDLRTRSCAVCDHLAKIAFAFYSNWQYALYTDEAAQRAFAAERGLCPLHLWQLEAVSSPTGVSVGHAKLVENVAHSLRRAAKTPRAMRVLPKLATPAHECRVCRMQQQAEITYIGRLVDFVREPAGRTAYARSPALCLSHLTHLVNVVSDEELASFLLDCGARRFEELAENMQSYGMKTEALRRELRHADEDDAYLRALTLLAGSRTVCAPWNSEAAI